eukprot:3622933-Prymnesium_polylepis.1
MNASRCSALSARFRLANAMPRNVDAALACPRQIRAKLRHGALLTAGCPLLPCCAIARSGSGG